MALVGVGLATALSEERTISAVDVVRKGIFNVHL